MNAKLVLAALCIALLVVACAPRQQPPAKPIPVVQPPAQIVQTAPATTDAAVSNIESSSAQVDQLDKDFDTSELDKLDQDLAQMDSMEFG